MFYNNQCVEVISSKKAFGVAIPVLLETKNSYVTMFKRNLYKNNNDVSQEDSQLEKSIESIILRLINENNKVSREEIARVAGVNVKTIARHLKKLSSKERYVGRGYSGHWEIIGE